MADSFAGAIFGPWSNVTDLAASATTSSPLGGSPTTQSLPPPNPSSFSSRDELRRIFAAHDIEDLTDQAYELYLAGVEDIEQLFFELEGTEVFRLRFPGIRDETGQAITNVAGFVEFERGVRSLLSNYGLDADQLGSSVRAFTGALIQQRRKLEELAIDLQAFDEVRNRPSVRDEFFAYTGVDPGPEGLFALALGLPQGQVLQRAYENAAERGVSAAEFEERLAGRTDLESIREALEPDEEKTREELLAGGRPTPTPKPFVTAEEGVSQVKSRAETLRALRRAVAAERARFQVGGRVVGTQEIREESF